jgi:hypothetical protein
MSVTEYAFTDLFETDSLMGICLYVTIALFVVSLACSRSGIQTCRRRVDATNSKARLLCYYQHLSAYKTPLVQVKEVRVHKETDPLE